MPYEDFKYIDTAFGDAKNRNSVKTLEDYYGVLSSSKIGERKDLINIYRTWLRFDSTYHSHWLNNTNGTGKASVSGYRGRCIFDWIPIDIDHENIEIATKILDKVLFDINKLVGLEYIEVYFSRSKGYHIYIPSGLLQPDPHEKNSLIAKEFVKSITDAEIDVKIYEINRIFSEIGSRKAHKVNTEVKTLTDERDHLTMADLELDQDSTTDVQDGRFLYKRLLSVDDVDRVIKNPREVYEICSEPSKQSTSKDHILGTYYWQFPSLLAEKWEEIKTKTLNRLEGRRLNLGGTNKIDDQEPQCIRNILKLIGEDNPDFDLNPSLSILTNYYLKKLPFDSAVAAVIKELNGNLSNPLPEQEIDALLRSSFERRYYYGCGSKDNSFGTLSFCELSGQCPKKLVKKESNDVWFDSAEALNRTKNRLNLGLPPLKLGLPVFDAFTGGFSYGETLSLQASPGSGKTALMLRMLYTLVPDCANDNRLVIMVTPEQNESDIVTRNIMQIGEMTKRDVYEKSAQDMLPISAQEWFKKYKDTMIYYPSSGHSIERVDKVIKNIEEVKGKKAGTVLIDGFSCLDLEEKVYGNKESMLFRKLVDNARARDYFQIVSFHLPKNYKSKDGEQVNLAAQEYGAKGTSSIFDLTTYLLGVSQEIPGIVDLFHLKSKERMDGGDLPKKVNFPFDKNYKLFTLGEAMRKGEHHFGSEKWLQIQLMNNKLNGQEKRMVL